jgi:hypothetical protein
MQAGMKKITRIPTLLFFLLIFSCAYSSAEQTGGCHCFRNRVFDPADRFVSDSYLLTTVFNSLTADYFSISKRQIIMLKMQGGVQGDDLLIGLYIGTNTGKEVTDLLDGRKSKTWAQILMGIEIPDQFRHDKLYGQILDGLPDTKAAEDITGLILKNRFGVTSETLNVMMQQGLSLREIALVLTLAENVHMASEIISSQYRDKGLSWSEIAHNFGLEPADVGKLAGKAASKQP